MQELVLYNMPVKFVYPVKTIPDKYSIKVPVPPIVLREHKNAKFGYILIDKKDIFYFATSPELNNICLSENTYSLRIKENDEYINVRVSALDIFLCYEAYVLAGKENWKDTPVLYDVPRTHLLQWKDTADYYLKISFPKRLLPYFANTEHAPVVYAVIHYEDTKPANTIDCFNITLKYTVYSVFVIMEDSKPIYRISRSELIDAYNNSQAIRTKRIQEHKEQVISQADTTPDTVVLRHLFRKNISSSTNDTISIAVPVPASLKNKCAKWFCSLHVPSSCVSAEPTVGNTELVSLTLTQGTYEVDYPVSNTEQYQQFHKTHWETAVVTRDELYEAHMNTLRTYGFYKENNLT